MKITADGAAQKRYLMMLIPLDKVSDIVRAKIIYGLVECENTLTSYSSDINKALEVVRPEGYAEKLEKFREALEPTGKNKAKAAKLATEEGFAEFKEEYDRYKEDIDRISKDFGKKKYEADFPKFTVEDFADISRLFPSGEFTEVDDQKVRNDDLIHDMIVILQS